MFLILRARLFHLNAFLSYHYLFYQSLLRLPRRGATCRSNHLPTPLISMVHNYLQPFGLL
jgi:hypothetical protein